MRLLRRTPKCRRSSSAVLADADRARPVVACVLQAATSESMTSAEPRGTTVGWLDPAPRTNARYDADLGRRPSWVGANAAARSYRTKDTKTLARGKAACTSARPISCFWNRAPTLPLLSANARSACSASLRVSCSAARYSAVEWSSSPRTARLASLCRADTQAFQRDSSCRSGPLRNLNLSAISSRTRPRVVTTASSAEPTFRGRDRKTPPTRVRMRLRPLGRFNP